MANTQRNHSHKPPSRTHSEKVVLHHNPLSRAVGVRWLLEELGLDYSVRYVDFSSEQGADESYRAIHPHKKVPAVELGEQVLTERAAITLYLADRYSAGDLAPTVDDPQRAVYLRMLVYCDAVFDPCVTARARGLTHAPADYSFGGFEDVMRHLKAHLRANDFAAGPRFTAADTQLASALAFTMFVLKVVPSEPEFLAYMERIAQRPGYLRAQQLDAELLKQVSAQAAQ